MDFEKLLSSCKPARPAIVAVAAAEDGAVLRAVIEAHERQIAVPMLCGDREKIRRRADECDLDISSFKIVHADSPQEAARAAVRLVRTGAAGMLMKGLLQTADLLRAVLDRENGLRKGEILSHVGILHAPALGRPILLTDAAMVPYPDLQAKARMIENAAEAAQGLGISCPKVAPIAAVEVVNPAMPATLDAAALTAMNRRGQIRGCIVDGPLALDLALSEEAAIHKGVESPVAGRADILLFHSIEAANSTLKAFTLVGGSLFSGLIMGARAPIVLTSRSDGDKSKLYSIACASAVCAASHNVQP